MQQPPSRPHPPTPRLRHHTTSHRSAGGSPGDRAAGGRRGCGGAWAIAGDDTGSTAGTGPATDARGACDALAGFDESMFTAEGDEGVVALNRWSGAITLSAAAAAGDPAYKSLSETLSRAQHRQARVFDFDAEVKKDLTEARRICTDI
ncbi:hypothetical protein NKH18_19085 [Streptomyces sp. M10(2022)]